MSHIFFRFMLFAFILLRLPLSILILFFRPFIPFVIRRVNFERKNLISDSSDSFRRKSARADYCFEISSEGELEQVRPLIEATVQHGKKIELVFSSPSVESKCEKLFLQFPEQVRIYRLPLMTGSPVGFLYFQSLWEWITAPVVIFCRYDFFPELLILKFLKKKFILISGAFKKRSWFKLQSFRLFDVVVAATDKEQESFKAWLPASSSIYSCDFRVPRISERRKNAESVFQSKKFLHSYIEFLKSLPAKKKLILGSAWKSDLLILQNDNLIKAVMNGDLHILIAPHKLDEESVIEIKNFCDDLFGIDCCCVVNEKSPFNGQQVVILQMSGILCELYGLFSISYVGGGYERSIHSVLEPFVMDNIVITGPKIHRSTELDLVLSVLPGEIHVLNRPESFYTIYDSLNLEHHDLAKREKFRHQSEIVMSDIIRDLLD